MNKTAEFLNCKIRFLNDPVPEEEYIAISATDLVEYIRDQMTLTALESGGVDNWEWHGESIRDYMADLPNCYGPKFYEWVKQMKAEDETVEDYIDDMCLENYAEYEVYVM